MVQVRQRLLAVGLLALMFAPAAAARRFYDDDPILREPAPVAVQKAKKRKINEYYDFFRHTFWEPDKENVKAGKINLAQAVNTMGEPPDSAWYVNRFPKMTLRDLARGPGTNHPPSAGAPWRVVSGKNEGISPGLVIKDLHGHEYVLKFDPLSNPEMASAADVIGSRFFYALGYNTPENYIVHFTRNQISLTDKSTIKDYRGQDRAMNETDLRDILRKAPRDREGRYRGMASFFVPGELLGPFRYNGTRRDDPNDIVPHEDRRDLRAIYVFAAWLNHTDSKSLNSLDTIIADNGVSYIKHYLIDFGAILGSDSFEPKSPRAGNVYLFDFKPAAWQFLSLGLYVPAWQRADYAHLPAAGHLEYEVFDPERWKPNYPNPAFDHRLPDDNFWAARKVMAFSDEQIRAIVNTGQFSDPRAADWIIRALIARRDKIGRAFFDDVLPLDHFRVERGRLAFDDLAVRYNFAAPRAYTVQWYRFDNEAETKSPMAGETSMQLPADLRNRTGYAVAEIRAQDPRKTVTAYVRNRGGEIPVVGIDRAW